MQKANAGIVTAAIAAVAVVLIFSFIVSTDYGPEPVHSDPVKIGDCFYEITYDSYSYRDAEYLMDKGARYLHLETGACSSVCNGDYYGRSFDFFINNSCQFVVKVNGSEDRYASIGVSGLDKEWQESFVESGMDAFSFRSIPWITLDGINECGVVCNTNVVPSADIEKPMTGTNPGKERLHYIFMPRYVLDNASTAREGVELLKNMNIIGSPNFMGVNGIELHLMISDGTESFVLEIVNNKLVVLEGQKIMTNFYLSLDDYTAHSMGVERYEILEENYDMGSTFEGMFDLIKLVRFSDYLDPDAELIRVSDHIGLKVNGKALNSYFELLEVPEDLMRESIAKIDKESPEGIAKLWWTTHASVFDISELKMLLVIHENYDNPIEYSIGDLF